MGRKKRHKKSSKKNTVQWILLATAIIQLTTAIITLINIVIA